MKDFRKPIFLLFCLFTVCYAGCQKEIDIPQADIIKIESKSSLMPLQADGTTIITFRATIPAKATDEARNVTFKISTGFGIFVGASSTDVQIVRSTEEGFADISLKIGKTPGTYYISAQIERNKIVYRSNEIAVTLLPIAFTDKLVLTPSNLTPGADGFSTVRIDVFAPFKTERSAKLTTSLGSFPMASAAKEITVVLDDTGKGTALLQMSTETGPYVVTGSFTDGTVITTTLNAITSYPELLIVEPSALSIDLKGTALVLRSILKKNDPNYKPSKGSRVSFAAYQLIAGAKIPVGRFTGTASAVSDVNGDVPAVNFYADSGNIKDDQNIILEITTPSSAGANITQTINLKIIK